jgi:hypothetical protein
MCVENIYNAGKIFFRLGVDINFSRLDSNRYQWILKGMLMNLYRPVRNKRHCIAAFVCHKPNYNFGLNYCNSHGEKCNTNFSDLDYCRITGEQITGEPIIIDSLICFFQKNW